MSQIFKPLTSSGPIPPNIPTTFNTQNGTPPVADGSATPALNIIIFAETSLATNTKDGFQVAASGNTVTYSLTNRFDGSVNTADATPTTVASLDLSTIGTGVFTFDVQIAGFDVTDNEGLGYAIFGTIKNIGGVLSVIGTPDKINNEDTLPVNITAADANLTVSGTSAIVQVTGIAAKDIHWRAVATFVYVG